jgi:hypothetical protein
MSDQEAARRQAEADYARNQQAQMKREQDAKSYEERIAYNAELDRQRKK